MANDIQNKENETDDESINIDDIEGLERDLSAEENKPTSSNNNSSNNEENEPLEILKDGKLKATSQSDETALNASNIEDSSRTQKNKKAIKILILVLLLLIIGIVAFVLLSNTEEKVEEKLPPTAQTISLPPLETYEFKLDHLNVSRLNKKLENLNKYELLGMTEEEYLKEEKIKALKKAQEEEALKEKMRLEQEALEKEALEKARLEEELAQKKQEEKAIEPTVENEVASDVAVSNETTTSETEESQPITNAAILENSGNEFLKFVQINTNQKAIYKTYLKKIQAIDMRINACRNINKNIEVFIGPLKNDENYTAIIEAIKQEKLSTDVVFIEVTKEEFAKRCMVEEN